MECVQETNKARCTRIYEPCARKHKYCECLHYHRKKDELPACFFTAEYEKTYDGSINDFLQMRGGSV